MNNTAFDGTADFFDSREVIERIAELDDLIEDAHTEENTITLGDLLKEREALIELRDEAEGNIPDFEYGEIFISEHAFTDYMMELLSDIGYLPADLPSWIVIDEEETASNMKVDYTEFEFRGTTYYAR